MQKTDILKIKKEDFQNLESDASGVVYGYYKNMLFLIKSENPNIERYSVRPGTFAIWQFAFYNHFYIEDIFLPDSVMLIYAMAFCECVKLKNIRLSQKLLYIGNNVFFDNKCLSNIQLPPMLMNIDGNPFACCKIDIDNLSPHFKIENKLLIHGSTVISVLKAPTSITVPDYITAIGDNAFYHSTRLNTISLPEGLTYIGNEAFNECLNLSWMNMPDTVKFIGKEAFCLCDFHRFTFPKSLSFIGRDALHGFQLLSVIIPGNLHIITNKTFYEPDYIDEVIISCSPDKSKNNGIRRRFRKLLGDELYAKVSLINSSL